MDKTIEVWLNIVRDFELTDNVVRSKIIPLEKDLFTIRNARCIIYWQQNKLLPLPRFYWLKPGAGLFYFQINVLSVFFYKFLEKTGRIVGFDYYNRILKQKYISKMAKTKYFYHLDNFFQSIIKALIMTLCIHYTKYPTIKKDNI